MSTLKTYYVDILMSKEEPPASIKVAKYEDAMKRINYQLHIIRMLYNEANLDLNSDLRAKVLDLLNKGE